MPRAVGVDWGSNGWVCASIGDDGEWRVSLQPSMLSVGIQYGEATDLSILVDIPIGLVQEGTRTCDQQAKAFLGKSGTSVFLTPPRDVLSEATYEDAKEATQRRTDHSLTTQAWGLFPRITEVDDFLQSSASSGAAVRESHPEVCFRKLARDRDDIASKHESAGIDERTDILDNYVPGTTDAYEDLVSTHIENQPAYARRFRTSNADDILDAMGLAVTSYVGNGTFERYGGTQRDPVLDRDIEIVYATG